MEKPPQKPWHHLTEATVFEQLQSQRDTGLSPQEIESRLQRFGPNTLTAQKPVSALKRFLLQFHNPLIYILLAATLTTFLLQEYIDSAVIFGVVIINAIIGYLQEAKAEEAINSLKKMLSASANVLRDGQRQSVPATELVPGDIVYLASGDKVPADLRLFECRDLQVDESALTGESVAVQKQRTELDEDTVLADRINLAFAGTLVTYGQATGLVTGTGDATETGKIAHMISEAVSLETPLTRKIQAFSKLLLYVILGLALITFVVGLFHGQDWVDTFVAAVALAVAAIPEGLPAVVTITLAIGVRRMARRSAIVRKLPAVETLGSTTIICSDKTGTLTENQMTVQKVFSGDQAYELTGSGYQPEGQIQNLEGQTLDKLPATLRECLAAGLLCNDSSLEQEDGIWQVRGDPTEGALITAALKAGLQRDELQKQHRRLDVIPFESDRQYMATLHSGAADQHVIYLKGSLERILERCKDACDAEGNSLPLDQERITAQAEAFGSAGLRVLCLARQQVPAEETTLDRFRSEEAAEQLTFIGLQAMIDPPREEAIRAVATCQQAGIAVKMITGDHAMTARAIAEQIGITPPTDKESGHKVLTGRELARLSDAELQAAVQEVAVFARVAPEQKLKLVTALQQQRQVVAMTGDGVNDAPALKQADIGVAMGITGTEVSKEAADMVLTDDNFATIEAAVEEGRTVFDNLIKFITWTLPTNMGQGLVIMVAILLGTTLPVLPVQALWINMTSAVLLGLMLAFEPKEGQLMERQPRALDAPLLGTELVLRILSVSAWLLIGSFGLFHWALAQGMPDETARTLSITLILVVQSFFLLNCRSINSSLWQTPWRSNRWIWIGISSMLLVQLAFVYSPTMNLLFHSAPLTLNSWLLTLGYGLLVLLMVEVEKATWRWWRARQNPAA